jgi:hypothetical protein
VADSRSSLPTNEPQYRLGDREFVHYLAREAASLLDERVQQREERRAKVVGVVTSIVLGLMGLIGAGVLTWLHSQLSSSLDRRVSELQLESRSRYEQLQEVVRADLDKMADALHDREQDLREVIRDRADDQQEVIRAHVVAQERHVESVLPLIEGRLSERTSALLSSEVEPLQKRLDESLQYQSLLRLANEMADASGFADAERDEAKRLIAALAGTGWFTQGDFAKAVEQVIDSFHAAGLSADIDELESAMEDHIVKSEGITYTMLEHYGQRALSAQPASQDQGHALRRFRHYAEVARGRRLLGRALVWELLLALKEDDEPQVERRIEELTYVQPRDASVVLRMLFQYCNPTSWMHRPDYRADQIATLANRLVGGWGDDLGALVARVETDPTLILPHGEEMIRLLMETMSGYSDEAPVSDVTCIELLGNDLPEGLALTASRTR